MEFCPLHRIGYSNSADECPLCARNGGNAPARGTA